MKYLIVDQSIDGRISYTTCESKHEVEDYLNRDELLPGALHDIAIYNIGNSVLFSEVKRIKLSDN